MGKDTSMWIIQYTFQHQARKDLEVVKWMV